MQVGIKGKKLLCVTHSTNSYNQYPIAPISVSVYQAPVTQINTAQYAEQLRSLINKLYQ